MKLNLIALAIISFGPFSVAEEHDQSVHPETKYEDQLHRLESEYVEEMRGLAGRAAAVRVYRLGAPLNVIDPFAEILEDRFFLHSDYAGNERAYKILGASAFIRDRELVKAWAAAVLPGRSASNPLDALSFVPTVAVKFLDESGESICATAVGPTSGSAGLKFPRYTIMIKIKPPEVAKLIESAGLSATRADQGGADQTATAPESKPEGEEKPQPESKGRSQ